MNYLLQRLAQDSIVREGGGQIRNPKSKIQNSQLHSAARVMGEGGWEFLIPNSQFLIRTECAYAL